MRRAIHPLIAAVAAFALSLVVASRARAQGDPPASQPAPVQPVLSLTANEPVIENESGGPLLVREILRQAVLLAARDQLHIPTRDQALRETLRSDAGMLDIVVNGKAPVSVRLTRGRGGELIW